MRFVPEQKQLSAVVRRIHGARRAYPVIEAAALFASNPQACRVKIESLPGGDDTQLFQCKKCGTVVEFDAKGVSRRIEIKLNEADGYEKFGKEMYIRCKKCRKEVARVLIESC